MCYIMIDRGQIAWKIQAFSRDLDSVYEKYGIGTAKLDENYNSWMDAIKHAGYAFTLMEIDKLVKELKQNGISANYKSSLRRKPESIDKMDLMQTLTESDVGFFKVKVRMLFGWIDATKNIGSAKVFVKLKFPDRFIFEEEEPTNEKKI